MHMSMNYAVLVLAFTLCMSISGSYEELVTVCKKFNPEIESPPDCEGETVTVISNDQRGGLNPIEEAAVEEITKEVVDEFTKKFSTRLSSLSEKIEQARGRLPSTSHERVAPDTNVNPPKSCDYINGTVDQSGVYMISPNSSIAAPFSVYCNFTGTAAETIISHDSMEEIKVRTCEAKRCYRRKITYDVTLSQAVALIEQSLGCRQFIKYRCVGSVMFRKDNPTFAAWLSRDGRAQIYWGGASHDRHCACGEKRTCWHNGYKCNCDRNAAVENSDEGYLTQKDSLPVTGVLFGDTGGGSGGPEQGWHTVGPLICHGRIQKQN